MFPTRDASIEFDLPLRLVLAPNCTDALTAESWCCLNFDLSALALIAILSANNFNAGSGSTFRTAFAYAIRMTNAAHIAERYAFSSNFVHITYAQRILGCHVYHHKSCGPCLITRLMSPLGVLEKLTEVHLKLWNFHTLLWSLLMRFRTTFPHYTPRTPRLIRQMIDLMACSFLS